MSSLVSFCSCVLHSTIRNTPRDLDLKTCWEPGVEHWAVARGGVQGSDTLVEFWVTSSTWETGFQSCWGGRLFVPRDRIENLFRKLKMSLKTSTSVTLPWTCPETAQCSTPSSKQVFKSKSRGVFRMCSSRGTTPGGVTEIPGLCTKIGRSIYRCHEECFAK